MKFLVLGSEGVVGSGLCNYLKKIKADFIRYDKLLSSKHDLTIFENNYNLEKCIEECDIIFFIAFDVGGSKYIKNDNFEIFNNNVKIIFNTFDLIKKHNKKSIFATSQMSNMTYNNYGLTKLVGERYSELVNGLAFKIWNCYGYQDPKIYGNKMYAINDFIFQAVNEKDIDMLTDGQEIRQYIHADDFGEALYVLAQNYEEIKKQKKIIDIASNKWYKIIEVAEIIKDIVNLKTGKNIKVIPSLNKATLQTLVNEPDTYFSKYWTPKINLEDGLSNIIDQYLSNY